VGASFADGQYWDDTVYPVGPDAVSAEVTLYYQTASKEYVEFLRDENTTNVAGNFLYDLWNDINMSEPVAMARVVYESDNSTVARCSIVISKLQTRVLKKYLKSWGRCMIDEARGLTCDSQGRDDRLGRAVAKLQSKIGGQRDRRCATANLTPATLGHSSACPAPCAGQVVLFDMGDVADCARCMVEEVTASTLEAAYGVRLPALPTTAVDGYGLVCQKSLAAAATRLTRSWAGALARCEEKSLAKGLSVDCEADPSGKIAKAKAKSAAKVSRCRQGFAGLNGCATAGDTAAVAACIEAAVAEALSSFTEVARR
jgi:hypothetical protein